ncbi:MAG TPA: histidine phosphatase family protein [Desulfuromonadales bacterium]|nr:histidine phosphatase family protein [Desulfuromonadales bacterium]
MKTLILARHAKSSWQDPDLADFDRPLNKRGRENAPLMGRRLAERGDWADLIVTSPARRAHDTATALAAALNIEERNIHFEPAIYEAEPADLLQIIRGFDDARREILLVGHNPGLTELANLLAPCQIDNIVTCGLVGLEFDLRLWRDVAPGQGHLRFYDYPRKTS